MSYLTKISVEGTEYQIKDSEAVHFTEQTLTDEQKAQARTNIGAASEESEQEMQNVLEIQKDYFVVGNHSANLLDESTMQSGYVVNPSNGALVENRSQIVTDYVSVDGLETVAIYSCLTDKYSPFQEFFRGALYDENKDYISGINNNPTENNPQRGIVAIPEGAKYIRVSFIIHPNFSKYMMTTGELLDYEKYYYGVKEIPVAGASWRHKTWLSYGDSITAIGNEVDRKKDGSWQMKVRDYFEMEKAYGRGIGGQTFVYNKKPWFANADGSYNSRDDNGDMTDESSYTVPEGCTAHYGYFASWDRICTMIPDEIKDTIDLITVFGVNDATNTFSLETWEPPVYHRYSDDWLALDEAWANAEENNLAGVAGDFDITTIDGAIASTILKLQIRCPNAVIVFGTSWSGKGVNNTSTGNYEGSGKAFYNHALRVKTVAHYYSIPVVDIWGTSGVNCFNRHIHNKDSTHPYYPRGKMMLARAWIGGLQSICPILD